MCENLSLREQQKAEAFKRMQILELHPNAINDFLYCDLINKSELCGILFWLDEEEQEIVKSFEDEHEAIVYHIIKDHTEFGTLLTLFYVSKHICEWERDNSDLKNNIQLCYVKNLDEDMFSEFGYIGFKKMIGGLQRTE